MKRIVFALLILSACSKDSTPDPAHPNVAIISGKKWKLVAESNIRHDGTFFQDSYQYLLDYERDNFWYFTPSSFTYNDNGLKTPPYTMDEIDQGTWKLTSGVNLTLDGTKEYRPIKITSLSETEMKWEINYPLDVQEGIKTKWQTYNVIP